VVDNRARFVECRALLVDHAALVVVSWHTPRASWSAHFPIDLASCADRAHLPLQTKIPSISSLFNAPYTYNYSVDF